MLHQTGTTFFTDGTSGWTQACAAEMMAQLPTVPEVPEYTGGGSPATTLPPELYNDFEPGGQGAAGSESQ